jgi:hypothetical protein
MIRFLFPRYLFPYIVVFVWFRFATVFDRKQFKKCSLEIFTFFCLE